MIGLMVEGLRQGAAASMAQMTKDPLEQAEYRAIEKRASRAFAEQERRLRVS